MRENVAKHLEFIQAIIARMAGNSFLLKGWTVTVSAALFELAVKDSDATVAVIALFPALSFWGLDAYYLRQERLFRKLYDAVRLASDQELQAMGVFSLSPDESGKEVPGWFQTLWSPTIIALHGAVVGVVVLAIILLR